MRPHPRRARTNPRRPRAWGTSDRNGFISNHENLRFQYEWSGTQLINKRILVSADELDKPNRQLGTIILPPDPVPIKNARPEQYYIDEYADVLFETVTPANIVGGFTGAENGDPIYAENSTPANTMALALEYGQYFETMAPVPTTVLPIPPVPPIPPPVPMGTAQLDFSQAAHSQYLPLFAGV